jgi:hypothetical protein
MIASSSSATEAHQDSPECSVTDDKDEVSVDAAIVRAARQRAQAIASARTALSEQVIATL